MARLEMPPPSLGRPTSRHTNPRHPQRRPQADADADADGANDGRDTRAGYDAAVGADPGGGEEEGDGDEEEEEAVVAGEPFFTRPGGYLLRARFAPRLLLSLDPAGALYYEDACGLASPLNYAPAEVRRDVVK